MEKLMSRFYKSSIISSVILLILGILLVAQSEVTILGITYIIGAVLIVLGVFAIIKFIRNTNNYDSDSLDIIYGVVTIILGIIVIYNPKVIASIIPIIIGIGIVINSATKLQYAFELKSLENNQWKITLVIAIISAICGVVLLCNPFKGAVALMQIIGGFIIVYALLDFVSTITIKKNVTAIHDALTMNTNDADVVIEEDTKKNNKNK